MGVGGGRMGTGVKGEGVMKLKRGMGVGGGLRGTGVNLEGLV